MAKVYVQTIALLVAALFVLISYQFGLQQAGIAWTSINLMLLLVSFVILWRAFKSGFRQEWEFAVLGASTLLLSASTITTYVPAIVSRIGLIGIILLATYEFLFLVNEKKVQVPTHKEANPNGLPQRA